MAHRKEGKQVQHGSASYFKLCSVLNQLWSAIVEAVAVRQKMMRQIRSLPSSRQDRSDFAL
jgi:hypothetical protein